MIKKKSQTLFSILILTLTMSIVFANSRVSFSRPGSMMRTPSLAYNLSTPYLFKISTSSEIVNFEKTDRKNGSLSLEMQNQSGFTFGLSTSKLIDSINSNEIGFHFQKLIFDYSHVSISMGIHDIIYRNDNEESLKIKDMSIFTVLTSKKQINDYNLAINFGIGTGKVKYDPHISYDQDIETAGVFVGFLLNTPYLFSNGGMDLLFEFDGHGINLGANIPFTKDYSMSFGITHFENFGEFGTESLTGLDYKPLQPDAPAFSIGVSMRVPNIELKQKNKHTASYNLYQTKNPNLNIEENLLGIIEELRDSLKIITTQLNNIANENTYLSQKVSVLMDSSRVYYLEKQIDQSNLNKISRHLTRCLRYFYSKEYREALSEVDKAIEINPNLAIAYARKGSIYYKLGEIQRATMNWNIALKLDPEFVEIQEILVASKENRLQSADLNDENN